MTALPTEDNVPPLFDVRMFSVRQAVTAQLLEKADSREITDHVWRQLHHEMADGLLAEGFVQVHSQRRRWQETRWPEAHIFALDVVGVRDPA